jgi:hypothetical protein
MRNMIAAAAAVLALAAGGPAQAQVGFGVAGGPSFPLGTLADAVDLGFHGGVAADIGLPLLPFSVRADAMFQRLPGINGGDSFQQVAGTLNGQLDLLPLPVVSAYVTGGVGLYGSNFGRDAGDSWTAHTGINAGVGAQVNLFVIRPFVEARFHRVLSDPGRSFLPVTVGFFF